MDAFKTPLPYVTLMNTASISKCRCEIKRPLFFWMAEASASALAVIRLTTGGNFAREINIINIYQWQADVDVHRVIVAAFLLISQYVAAEILNME